MPILLVLLATAACPQPHHLDTVDSSLRQEGDGDHCGQMILGACQITNAIR
jgi:hypothetical protein